MGKIISIHSFRGGTGKSNTTANLAYLLAKKGLKVGVVDTDIQSPGIHIIFNENEPRTNTLNDYLWGNKGVKDITRDLSERFALPSGHLNFIPSSINMGDITRILKEGYDVSILNRCFQEMIKELNLDYLLIDTHPGLNEETLLSIAISDILIIVMRPDQQDFQGTSVTVEIARRLKCENIILSINKVLSYHDPEQVKNKVESVYKCKVGAVLPLSEKIVELASADLATRKFPDEKWSQEIAKLAELIVNQ